MTDDDLKARRHFELPVHRPEQAGAEADEELAAVLDEQIHHLMAQGMTAEAAREQALGRLGAPLPIASRRLHRSAEHRARRMRLHEWLEDLGADLRYAVRTLSRSPALTGAAVLTLALAIGANTAIFSAVSAVMLRPLPFADPGRLVMLWEENPDFKWYQQDAAPANMFDWREQVGAFADVAGYPSFPGTITLTGFGEPRMLASQQVTGNFFNVLGVTPELGRVFREEETWDPSPRTAVLSHRTWRTVFGADRGLIGKTVELGGRPVEVVGVLSPRFAYPGVDPDVWLPMRWNPTNRAQVFFRRAHWIKPVARLKPGVTPEAANAELQTVVARLQREYPATNTRMGAGLTPLHEFLVGKTRLPLLVMFGGVAVLLLIACANVANLLLVRAGGGAGAAVPPGAGGEWRVRRVRRGCGGCPGLVGYPGARRAPARRDAPGARHHDELAGGGLRLRGDADGGGDLRDRAHGVDHAAGAGRCAAGRGTQRQRHGAGPALGRGAAGDPGGAGAGPHPGRRTPGPELSPAPAGGSGIRR